MHRMKRVPGFRINLPAQKLPPQNLPPQNLPPQNLPLQNLPPHSRRAVLALLSLGCGAALAQPAPPALTSEPLTAPPPLAAPATATSPAAPATARTEAADEATPADLPPARRAAPETKIEQRRSGNRVVEVVVTPAGSTRSYTIVNREGQRPTGVQDLSSGLSTPRFFQFEF
jgi:hypothetical protein